MINLLTPIVDETGEAIVIKVPKKTIKKGKEVDQLQDEELNLKKIIRESMLKDFVGYPHFRKPKTMKKRYDLFMKIKDEVEVNLTGSEKKLILKFAALRFDVLIIGQIINILN